jgi:hypothetical protein
VGVEQDRVTGFGKLEDGLRQASDWYVWGPYVSERQWGTVREDYSPDGEAWAYFPHDPARSRAYWWLGAGDPRRMGGRPDLSASAAGSARAAPARVR